MKKNINFIFATLLFLSGLLMNQSAFSWGPTISIITTMQMDYQALEDLFNKAEKHLENWSSKGESLQKGLINLQKEMDQLANTMTNLYAKSFFKVAIVTAGGLGLIATGYHGTKIGLHYLERQLYRPTVITEYYNNTLYNRLKDKIKGRDKSPEMILHPLVQDRLSSLIKETQNTAAHIKAGKKNVKYSNILLAGAPGTGKTMFAKRLAKESGMSYAFVSAGSFFQEGAGIAAIKELFAWAKKSNGLLLFIDEADGLFVERTKLKADSEQYKIVCEFLTYLGERSDKFMLVMATNHKVIFDQAMHSRIDDLIEMPLPDENMRKGIIELYSKAILLDQKANGKPFADSAQQVMTPKQIALIAHQTEGLSNRDLQAIINTIAKRAFATDNALVTAQLVNQTVKDYMQKARSFNHSEPKAALSTLENVAVAAA